MHTFPSSLPSGPGTTFQLDRTRLLLCFATAKTLAEIEAAVRDYDLVPESLPLPTGERQLFDWVNHTATRIWVRTRDAKPLDDHHIAKIANHFPDLAWIGPVYESPGHERLRGHGCLLPHVLVIRPQAPADQNAAAKFDALLASLGLKEDIAQSRYLSPFRYFAAAPRGAAHAFALRTELLQKAPELFAEIVYEHMPMIRVLPMVPSDTYFERQWNLTRIGAAGAGRTGWDLSTGSSRVIICILDWGVDRSHPEINFASDGINLGTMTGNGDGTPGDPTRFHGTGCAGIAAARVNNGTGVAGIAGDCRILPVAFTSFSNVEVTAGINYAVSHGASVISMSFIIPMPDPFTFGMVNTAIENAATVHDCVLVAATGNYDSTRAEYPAAHRRVIAAGGSDQEDNRKTPTSPDGECWGANYGLVSVVAPCVLIPTTDRRDTDGLNPAAGGSLSISCITYLDVGDEAGDYFFLFNGTSAAAPQIAGLAALLRSRYPGLTAPQVRSVIERTAEKVGVVPYANVAGYVNGPRNDDMGYGRINVFRALDFADVLIRDWPGDGGEEPSTAPGGNFWDFSDIVIRPADDDRFNPSNPLEASRVERGRAHFLYVRITNNGPQEARSVVVTARITPYVGLEFVYPGDWIATDATHVEPAARGGIPRFFAAGASFIAKFDITADQVEELWGWSIGRRWHPCVLASVTAENDYAFASAAPLTSSLVTRRNNLAQRNLSVIGVSGAPDLPHEGFFPVVAGNHLSEATVFELVVDRTALPVDAEVLLSLDENGSAFPRVDFTPSKAASPFPHGESIVLRERASFDVDFENWRGVVTLEKGSRLDGRHSPALSVVEVKGGEVVLRDARRFVRISADRTIVRLRKAPKSIHPLAVQVTFPSGAGTTEGFQHAVRVAQRNEKSEVVGGATAVFVP